MKDKEIDFSKWENHPMFAEGKKKMKEWELSNRQKRRASIIKKRIKSRRKRKQILNQQ